MLKLTVASAALTAALAVAVAGPVHAQSELPAAAPAPDPGASGVGVDASATVAPIETPPTPEAEPPARPTQSAASVDKTPVGVLLDTPAYRTVFERHFPEAVANPRLAQGRKMTLRQMQMFAPKEFTNERLSAMDADLKSGNAS